MDLIFNLVRVESEENLAKFNRPVPRGGIVGLFLGEVDLEVGGEDRGDASGVEDAVGVLPPLLLFDPPPESSSLR